MKRILFITAGPETWASSRLRAFWPAKYLDGARAVQADQLQESDVANADVYVFQKVGPNPEFVDEMKAQGKQVYWDVCDPMWWWCPEESLTALRCVNGVVCSSVGLVMDLTEFAREHGLDTPITMIRDRLELSHYPLKRTHSATSTVHFIWYGIWVNRIALFGALANLDRLETSGSQIELTICDERPDVKFMEQTLFPVRYARWDLKAENEIIAGHDIALLPPYPGPWGRAKSNNKALTAWACGLPVTTGFEWSEMRRLMDPCERQAEAEKNRCLLEESYQVQKSAQEWAELVR